MNKSEFESHEMRVDVEVFHVASDYYFLTNSFILQENKERGS